MPTINLSIDITAAQADKLQRWFPRWNASLDTPYATFEDALIGVLKHQIAAYIQSQDPVDIQDAYASASPAQRRQITDLMEELGLL
jgi:hypothetical protein